MKVDELKVIDLKIELERRDLPTTGNKSELIIRLREAIEREGLDPDNYDFVKTPIKSMKSADKSAVAETSEEPSGNFDMAQLLAAIKGEMNQMLKLQTDNQMQSNQMMMAEINQSNQMMAEIKQSNQSLGLLIVDGQKRIDEKFLEVESKVEQVEERLEMEINELGQKFLEEKEEMERLRKKLHDIETKGTITQVVQAVPVIKLKPPIFDGTTSFGIFKFQFETAAKQNGWIETQRVAALIVALKGDAAETLQTIPVQEREGYDQIMQALERKYGSDHKRELYRMELKGRFQNLGESLQDYAAAIERLVHLAHTNTAPDQLERIKMDAFMDGIRDPETRKALVLSPKTSFAETIACALINETAQAITKPSIKMRRVEIDTSVNMEQPRPKLRDSNRKIICWVCEKAGHISRECRHRKRGRSPSPWRRNLNGERVTAKVEGEVAENPLN